MSDLDRARALLAAGPGLYVGWKAECEALVTRWEWADFKRHSVEPHFFEVHKFTRGHVLPAEPKPPRSGATGHGFDREGRLVVTRGQTDDAERFTEEFVRYVGDALEVLFFDYDESKRVVRADVHRLASDRVNAIATVASVGSHFLQTFRYDGAGRLVEIERRGHNGPYGPVHDFRAFEYDAAGSVARIAWRNSVGRTAIDFERPSAAETFPAVRETLRASLTAAIVESINRQALGSPAYAAAVTWSGADYHHFVPPLVRIGLAADRDRALLEHGHEEARETFLWSPVEWSVECALELSPSTRRTVELANQDIWQNERFDETEAFFRELTAQLPIAELVIPMTDEFFCYATNIDLDRGVGDAREQSPERIYDRLRQRKLL